MKFPIIAIAIALGVVASSAAAAPPPHGSQHPRVGQLAELTFAPRSSELFIKHPRVALQLGQIAGWAKDNPDGLVVLDGHADRRGGPAANIRLSLRRAQAVRAELVAVGVDPDQIVIAAYGDSDTRPRRRVVVWGTRSGMDAVVARTLDRGRAVIWTGMLTEADRRPQPGIISRR